MAGIGQQREIGDQHGIVTPDRGQCPLLAILVSPVARIEEGMFILPTGPGWGVEVNEEVIPGTRQNRWGRWER
jgi:L-alanine-DL-glutamate epimerase-like enolase superfamily enzyme